MNKQEWSQRFEMLAGEIMILRTSLEVIRKNYTDVAYVDEALTEIKATLYNCFGRLLSLERLYPPKNMMVVNCDRLSDEDKQITEKIFNKYKDTENE